MRQVQQVSAMFAGERLRADLRDLHRLYAEMTPSLGPLEESEVKAAKPSAPLVGVNVELLQAVHERTLLAVGLVLRALESLPLSAPPSLCRCVSRPARLSAAPLVALLWAQVCQLKARLGQQGDAALGEPEGGPSSCSSCATQTEASCLRRCEACHVAEAAVKALIQAFSTKLEEPSVTERRDEVAAGLCHGRLSQWGAMTAVTAALCSDLDAALRSKGAALAALEVERSAAREARREADAATQRALKAEQELGRADESVGKLQLQERMGRKETELWVKEVEAGRTREADLLAQLQASKAALDQTESKLRLAQDELECTRIQAEGAAEALKAEQSKLRKQVKQAQERHALLLRYPDLHGPIQPLQHEPGDPVLDMECQVRANEQRVSLLTTQNERLRTTIAKLRVLAASGRPPTRNHSRPTSASSPCPSPSSPTSVRPSSPCNKLGVADAS